MKAGRPLRRGKALGRHRELKRTPFRSTLAAITTHRPAPAVPPPVRHALKTRSGGFCEIQLSGCQRQGIEASHRITGKAGGRHGEAKAHHDRLSDLTYACRPCHRWITGHPADAQSIGLALEEWQSPAEWPVQLILHDSGLVFLTDDGRIIPFEEGP